MQIILGVFVRTFPLTVAVAFSVFLYKVGGLNVLSRTITIIVASLVANLSGFPLEMPTPTQAHQQAVARAGNC